MFFSLSFLVVPYGFYINYVCLTSFKLKQSSGLDRDDNAFLQRMREDSTMFTALTFRKLKKMAPPYRVLLHNDNFNKREYVVQVLMKVIPGMTLDNAVNIMQEAHHNGMAVVIICAQVDAEEHCMQLRGNGLLSSIEPASGGCE